MAASSREQAGILHRQAAELIYGAGLERRALPGDRREPTRYEGVFEVRDGMYVIRFERGRIRVISHEARTGDGVIPTLALVDELHRHPSGELYGLFRDGIDARDGQMITISTAGAAMDSPLGRLLESARELPGKVVRRRHTYQDGDGFAVLEWALHPDDDPDDIRQVKWVNPAPWHTPEKLKRRHDSPSTSRGQWLRFACGIWTEGDEPSITGAEWDQLRADIGAVRPGEWVTIAPSVGHNAAIGIAARREDGRVAVRAEVLEPREGFSLLGDVEQRCLELADRYRVEQVASPAGGFTRSGDILRAAGLPVVDAPLSTPRLIAATSEFDRLRRARMLSHDGDPELRAHVLAGSLRSTEQGERYMISDRARGLIAVLMATYAATAPSPAPLVVLPGEVG
jgi:hypothetical protein